MALECKVLMAKLEVGFVTYKVGKKIFDVVPPMFEEILMTFGVIFAILRAKKRKKLRSFFLVVQRYNIFGRNPNLL